MKKIISYFLSGIVLCTALLVTPVSAAEVAPAEETITINSTVSGACGRKVGLCNA